MNTVTDGQRTMKVLIVDDNAEMRRLLRGFVARLAEAVYECEDGAEAVEAYAAEHLTAADWVLMDIEMPRVDGLEATRQLKRHWPDARVRHRHRLRLAGMARSGSGGGRFRLRVERRTAYRARSVARAVTYQLSNPATGRERIKTMKRRIIIALLLLSASIGFGTLTERGVEARRAIPNPVVTNLNDIGAGSLRQAIIDADAGGTITFQAGLTGAITLASQLTIDKDLTIQGPGANLLTINGNQAVRVFDIPAGNVTLSGLTIANGRATGNAPVQAGGIRHTSGGTLTLQQCVLASNAALSGLYIATHG
jgi:CheY-like chemotaxis protein